MLPIIRTVAIFKEHLKRIIGSHFANYREAWEANRLIQRAKVHPTLSRTYTLNETGHAVRNHVDPNRHQGKVSRVCAWRPRTASASATLACAPSTRTRSTGSATSEMRPLTRGRQRSVVHLMHQRTV